MEVILKKDFISLGYEGDICKVKDGYAQEILPLLKTRET